MSACEKCWADAGRRAQISGRSQTECYAEFLEERKNNLCSEKEQKGDLNENSIQKSKTTKEDFEVD